MAYYVAIVFLLGGVFMAKFRILSFDGGGVRGALSVNLLKRLNDEYPQLIEDTNLFAGTSTGAFIALGLAYGLKIEELVELFSLENARYIFSPRGLGLWRPKYNNKRLKEVLLRVFPQELKLSDLSKYVLIPSFRLNGSNSDSWRPIFFNNFKDSNTKNITVIDAALYSSAAPIYFPSYKFHVDGGLIANNPCTAAIAMASDPYYANQIGEDICLLSIGTGFCPHKITTDTTKWGLFQWMFNSKPAFPLETIMFDGSVEADSYFSYQFLKDRFYRLNPKTDGCIALNHYQQIPNLIALANKYDIGDTLTWINSYWSEDEKCRLLNDPGNNQEKARYFHNWHNKPC